MADDQTLSRLLVTLYAAPTTPELWTIFLQGTCDEIGASNAALIAHDTATDEHRVFGLLGDNIADSAGLYAERYWKFDEWTRRGFSRSGSGRVLIGSEVWPHQEFLQSVSYNEFLKQFDIRSVASVGTGSIPGRFEALSIYRSHSEHEFSPENIALLEMLLPHLQIAMATRSRLLALESRLADMENVFNLLESAVVLLNAACRVVLANDEARSILGQGQSLCLRNSKLIASNQDEAAKLHGLIANASATANFRGLEGGGVMLVRRAGKKPLHLLVSPLRSESAALPGRAVAAVFLTDPERHVAVPVEVLRTLFQLTPAEARLATSLFEGLSLSQAAELNCVSRETVKSQIASIFLKTGARGQSELMRFMARLPNAK